MSRGLGNIEKQVLRLCVKCLFMKEKIIKDKTPPGGYVYPGGKRFLHPVTGEYIRGISIGRYSEKGRLEDENLIDLKEVHHHYIEKHGIDIPVEKLGMKAILTGRFKFKEISPAQEASYQRALGSLKRKGYIIAGQFPPALSL